MKTQSINVLTAFFLLVSIHFSYGQIAPNLNSAGNFAILAGTGISFNGGTTTINNMDVGLSPGFRSSITGSYVIIGGADYAADDIAPPGVPAMLAQAKLDLQFAYLFAAGQAQTEPTISGNQGGLTLAPGVYKSTSTLSINGTPLTLNGTASDVWIFQIASTLTTTAGGSVIMSGGAVANNVYWQVGTSATIGSGTNFKGNILAYTSVSVDVGATIDGRALAQNGAVTFAGAGVMNEPDETPGSASNTLSIDKTSDKLNYSAVGEVITYEIVVENIGTVTLTNVDVDDDLTNDSWIISSLGPGESNTFTTSYTITQADFDNGSIKINIATADDGTNSVNDFAVVTKMPPLVPVSNWALLISGVLIAGFILVRFLRQA